MFAMMCMFNEPIKALQLWNENKKFMIEDLLLRHDNATAENVALHFANNILKENCMNCIKVGLPEPVGEPPRNENNEENLVVNANLLNAEQRDVFNCIVHAAEAIVRGEEPNNRLFYLDAPGGSGKTFLFNMMHGYLVSNNLTVCTSAWTGIAATLLKNGKTLHSIFKLLVPLSERSVCNVAPNSEQATILRQIKVFIIDEAIVNSFQCIGRYH
ncbi:uncharacterized protein LOC143034731 [Oratosquilla oratoria]|uniref:uncharacterized protein LOC143034731 n=1 Tax=Oratosquilla oratoria TaxID=337810 RepID=UPI003F775E1D